MGVTSFSVELFLSHSVETFRRGTFCAAFQKTSGSEEFNGYEGDGRVSRFAVEIFFLSQFRRVS